MSERRILLGMPGYGRQTAAAGVAFYRASADMSRVHCEYQQGSLLASNFNQLWCRALNFAHDGKPVTYFAMLHDDVGPLDVGPEHYWLDMLIDELEANNLDVLSVAIPIKDRRGMTSMALQSDDAWMPYARLSIRDVHELPETFTADDLAGRKLLLNTGCWVAKWGPWCEFVHFEIKDRIVFNRAHNRYEAQTMPEDWHFSRQLNEIGTGPTAHLRPLRIGATRKIRVHHRGEQEFANYDVWGTHHYDEEVVNVSPVPGAWPSNIPGWLKPAEGKALAELARGKRVLEIGSYCGLSTVCMGRTAEHVTAVDYFDGRGTPKPMDCRPTFDWNMRRHGIADKVVAVHPDDPYPLEEYDLAFIDGSHDAVSVRSDAERACLSLAEYGVLVFHDYRQPSHPGVTEAVDDLLAEGGELISIVESLAVVRPPAAIPLEV